MRILSRYWPVWLFLSALVASCFGLQEWYRVQQYEAAAKLYQEALRLERYADNEFEQATIGEASEIFRREANHNYDRLHFLGRSWVDPDLTMLVLSDPQPLAPNFGRLYDQMILAGYQQIRARILQQPTSHRARSLTTSALGFFYDQKHPRQWRGYLIYNLKSIIYNF